LQQTKLIGFDTRPGDYFGGAVGISGDTVVSLAANEDGAGEDAGAAYVFTRSGIEWSQQAKLVGNDTARKHHFGRSVSINGDSVAIGTRASEGGVYVFSRAETTWGPLWSEEAKLQSSDNQVGDEFGRSVGISGDVLVVGAPYDNAYGNYAGAAYIFVRFGRSWTQEAKIWGKDTRSGNYFGDIVAISGATVVVGTGAEPFGAAYVFTLSGSAWTQQAKIYRSGAITGDNFGASLSIYHNTLAVGAPGDNAQTANEAGAVYVFTRSGEVWSEQAKIVAPARLEGDRFGSSVSVSGYLLAVLAQGARDEAGNFAGSVHVFAQSGSDWMEQVKVSGKDTVFGDRFGASVGISGKYLAAGAPREDQAGTGAGAAYVHKCVTTTTTTTRTWTWTTVEFQLGLVGGGTRAKAITSLARGRPVVLGLLVTLSILAACH